MANKRMKFHLNAVIKAAEQQKCKDLKHRQSDKHADDVMCPVEYSLNKHIYEVRQYMLKENM